MPETREIDRGDSGDRRAPGRVAAAGSPRRPVPRDAAGAYRVLLEDLEAHPALRREAGETPGRARGAAPGARGTARLALELLAADYGLARFGGVAVLRAREHRRAIARARSLARDLPRVTGAATPAAQRRSGECRDAPSLAHSSISRPCIGSVASDERCRLPDDRPSPGTWQPTSSSGHRLVRFAIRIGDDEQRRHGPRRCAEPVIAASFGPSRPSRRDGGASSSALGSRS